jgi:hypothetical protein
MWALGQLQAEHHQREGPAGLSCILKLLVKFAFHFSSCSHLKCRNKWVFEWDNSIRGSLLSSLGITLPSTLKCCSALETSDYTLLISSLFSTSLWKNRESAHQFRNEEYLHLKS